MSECVWVGRGKCRSRWDSTAAAASLSGLIWLQLKSFSSLVSPFLSPSWALSCFFFFSPYYSPLSFLLPSPPFSHPPLPSLPSPALLPPIQRLSEVDIFCVCAIFAEFMKKR